MRIALLVVVHLLLCLNWVNAEGEEPKHGLTFESMLVDVHAPADASKVSAEFSFENKTDKTIKITKLDASCSCLSALIKPKRFLVDGIAPGEKGVITANFALGSFKGTVTKPLTLITDQGKDASIYLSVRVHIPILFDIQPKTLVWGLGEQVAPRKFTVMVRHEEPIHILSHRCTNESFAYEIKAIEEGRRYEVTVTPKQTNDPALGILSFVTDCKIAKHKRQQAFMVVRKSIPKPEDL